MPPGAGANSPKSPRILIVDDDAGQRSLLDSFLKGQGFETVPVASGEQALEMLRTQPFDMMISDVRMPGISGLETLRLARKEHAVLPVLLVTAYADIREAVGAMRDGAVNYLAKPIDLDELLASVRQATGIAERTPLKFSADKPAARSHRGPKSADAGGVSRRLAHRAFREPRAHHRRKRRRQGSARGRDPRLESARRRAAGQGELRRHSGNAAGGRTVRSREGRVHRRLGAAHRPL